jgi:hypothetical protein
VKQPLTRLAALGDLPAARFEVFQVRVSMSTTASRSSTMVT